MWIYFTVQRARNSNEVTWIFTCESQGDWCFFTGKFTSAKQRYREIQFHRCFIAPLETCSVVAFFQKLLLSEWKYEVHGPKARRQRPMPLGRSRWTYGKHWLLFWFDCPQFAMEPRSNANLTWPCFAQSWFLKISHRVVLKPTSRSLHEVQSFAYSIVNFMHPNLENLLNIIRLSEFKWIFVFHLKFSKPMISL